MATSLADLFGGEASSSAGSALVTIYIVRHGDTKFNSDGSSTGGKIRGWSNVGLTADGVKEAQQAALRLKGKRIAGIVASDLERAQQTAKIIGKALGIKPEFSADLRTLNTGDFTATEHKKSQPKIDAIIRKSPDQQIPGGESFNQFVARVFKGFSDAVAKYPGKPIAIISHHSPVSVIEAWESKGQPEDHSLNMKVYFSNDDPPGGVITLHTTEAALKGNGMPNDYAATNDLMRQKMGEQAVARDDAAASSPRQQFMDKIAQAVQQGPQPAMRDTLAHGRAIAGAKALHAVGHIDAKQRDKHIKASQKAIGGARKPFGSFAPEGPEAA